MAFFVTSFPVNLKAQGTYINIQSFIPSPLQSVRVMRLMRDQYPHDSIYDIAVSRCQLTKFHEYGDYGPCTDGETFALSNTGFLVHYHSDNTEFSYCRFHRKKDLCNGMKSDVFLFIPDDVSCCYQSYTCHLGFPPSFGGAARRKDVEGWHRKLLKIIETSFR